MLLIILSSCERVANVDVPMADPMPVMYSFLSPETSLSTVTITMTAPIYGNNSSGNFETIRTADVTISDNNGASAKMIFDANINSYFVNQNDFPINPGLTYTIEAKFDNYSLKASTTVPSLAIYLDEAIGEKLTTDPSGAERYLIRMKWKDAPGVANYYRVNLEELKSLNPGDSNAFSIGDKMFSDINKDGEIMSDKFEYYDKRQLVRKILLNSAYGALLNEHCRFYDKRIGQSVTLSGRQIVKHMMSTINESVTGDYNHEGPAIVYGDTDSCYFTAYPILKEQIASGELEWNKETCIGLYDGIADQANESFPAFMEKAFHAPRKNGAIIKAGRELIGDRAIFIVKKRYAINIFDKEGKRKDKDGQMGDIKAMGLDLKRADTPKYVQEFLMNVLQMVLQQGKGRDEVIEAVKDFKRILTAQDSWTKGSPKGVNKLTYYGDLESKSSTGRANMPGHVRAALNYNYLRRVNGDQYSQKIIDGMKVIVCKLKPNPLGFTSVAYPVDELRLPQWFCELPFDDQAMEQTLVDWLVEQLDPNIMWTPNAKELYKQAKEMEAKQKIEHQLFIGKVTCIIGFDKTLELLKESKLKTL